MLGVKKVDSTKLTYDINKRLDFHAGLKVIDVTDQLDVSPNDIFTYCETIGINPDCLYYNEYRYPSFYYYDFPVYFDIVDWQLDNDDSFVLESLKRRIETCRTLFESGHLERYFQFVQGVCSKDILVNVFYEHKEHLSYAQLRRFYISQFHGHVQASTNMMRHALTLRPQTYAPPLPYDQPTYTVYRGAGRHSRPLKDCWFWTLNLMDAANLAASATDDPIIYEATVKKEHVIDFFPKSGRAEIVIAPEHIENVRAIQQREALDFSIEMKEHRLADEFNFYRHTFIKPRQYANESDLHGTAHTTRVLLFVLALAHLEQLDTRSRAIVANAAIYHAIGRTDILDKTHVGEASLKQLKRLKYPLFIINCANAPQDKKYTTANFTSDEKMLIHRLIANNSKPFEDALSHDELRLLPDGLEERYAHLSRILRDAHALDDIRTDKIQMDKLTHPLTETLITYAIRCYTILESM